MGFGHGSGTVKKRGRLLAQGPISGPDANLVRYEPRAAMAIMVPVDPAPAEEAALGECANAEGVSIESLLHEAVLHLIATGQDENRAPLTAEQWESELVEWLDSMPDLPSLSDEALSRESMYTAKKTSGDD